MLAIDQPLYPASQQKVMCTKYLVNYSTMLRVPQQIHHQFPSMTVIISNFYCHSDCCQFYIQLMLVYKKKKSMNRLLGKKYHSRKLKKINLCSFSNFNWEQSRNGFHHEKILHRALRFRKEFPWMFLLYCLFWYQHLFCPFKYGNHSINSTSHATLSLSGF